MHDEPRRHRGFMLALGLVILATAPFPFAGGSSGSLLGIPLWLWWSGSFTTILAGLTAWGLLRFWRDDERR